MFIDLVESLRCVELHEESWLVAAFDEMDGRVIVRGTLGCPVCRRRYPIIDRITWLGVNPGSAAPRLAVVADEREGEAPGGNAREVMRLAALLGLAEPGGLCVLEGSWATLASALFEVVVTQILVVNPDAPVAPAIGVSILRTPDTLPLAGGAVRAVGLGDARARAPHAWTPLLAGAVHALARRGRLVAPSGIAPPPGIHELARDDRHWVAERLEPESPPVTLRVVRGR